VYGSSLNQEPSTSVARPIPYNPAILPHLALIRKPYLTQQRKAVGLGVIGIYRKTGIYERRRDITGDLPAAAKALL